MVIIEFTYFFLAFKLKQCHFLTNVQLLHLLIIIPGASHRERTMIHTGEP